MDSHPKSLLLRWQSLEKGNGLQRASSLARVLSIAGFVLCLVVVFGIYYNWSPIAVAFAAAAMGFVIAECNALRSRSAQREKRGRDSFQKTSRVPRFLLCGK
jgi:hypothetical protein